MTFRRLGSHSYARDVRRQRVEQRRRGIRGGSTLDDWDRLAGVHLGRRATFTDHFAGSALLPHWTWAGAPFVTPGTVTVSDSVLEVTNFTANTRAFLYQPTIDAENKVASVALKALTQYFWVGVRLDDGTDNNYVELVLQVSQSTPTHWQAMGRRRVGGGVIATYAGDTMNVPLNYVLRLVLTGTTWTNWGFVSQLQTPHGIGGIMWKPNNGPTGLAWTPTRVGLVFYAPLGTAADEAALIDWVNLFA